MRRTPPTPSFLCPNKGLAAPRTGVEYATPANTQAEAALTGSPDLRHPESEYAH